MPAGFIRQAMRSDQRFLLRLAQIHGDRAGSVQ